MLLALATLPAGAVPVVIGPGDPRFQIVLTDSTGTPGTGTGTGEFVSGPASPPGGGGSFRFAPATGDDSVQLRTALFSGTLLSDITALSYSTFATAWNGAQVPFVSMWIDLNGDTTVDDRVVFEPTYSAPPNPALNVWQTWDVLAGNVYSLLNPVPLLFSNYVAARPSARIIDAAPGLGGFRIASGFGSVGDTFDANVDNLTFGTALGSFTFNFEASVPELDPAGGALPLCLCAGLLAALSPRRRLISPQ
jgi:hypothetical protein